MRIFIYYGIPVIETVIVYLPTCGRSYSFVVRSAEVLWYNNIIVLVGVSALLLYEKTHNNIIRVILLYVCAVFILYF